MLYSQIKKVNVFDGLLIDSRIKNLSQKLIWDK